MNYGLIGRLILIGMPIPENRNKVLKDLKDEKFIHKNDGGSWDITNYGALMIAADLKLFDKFNADINSLVSRKKKV